MGNNKRKNTTSFLAQGTILAAASLISRVIGLIYGMPLTAIIGDTGNDYYGSAYTIYNILLIISSYSLPLAVSKLVSANISQGRRRNVYRILKCALIFALVSGTAAAAILYFGADFITGTLLRTPLCIFALKVLVPVLVIVAVLGVMRGFFQGLGTMMPSAVSQILEQIVNAIVSVWAAYVLFSYGSKAGALLGNAEDYGAAYGAAGGTIGTAAGALSALLFAGFVLVVYLRVFKKTLRKERKTSADSYGEIFKLLIITIIPVLVSSTIYNCNATIDQAVYKNIAAWQGYSQDGLRYLERYLYRKIPGVNQCAAGHCILPCGIECAGALCCLCERKTGRSETADWACHTLYHGRGIPVCSRNGRACLPDSSDAVW